ncbi:hypothetical protein [Methylorubrum extorquens]|uniref:hypothetical protein n=1 Tax=Methylorubrum extorquens TaxID=408 RepID=UPI0022390A48|nr:hypothetical protein [Methylorubrum extorquens]UYW34457.1 hypothetical protein OKB92_10365 [Methylorubrum extorquens]
MAKRQTRPLTPAEAVRKGRKLIAERRRQARAANPLPVVGEGGAEPAIGMPISEQDQRVEVVLITPVEPSSTPPAAEPTLIFAATIEAAKVNTHADGEWPLTDLRARQCRFACTADNVPRDQHRFCGRRTHVGPGNLHGSWCDEHLPRVWGQGSVSERNAHHVTKDVRRFG